MSKHWKDLNNHVQEEQVVNMRIVIKHLRNSKETPSTENLIILRNLQYWQNLNTTPTFFQ